MKRRLTAPGDLKMKLGMAAATATARSPVPESLPETARGGDADAVREALDRGTPIDDTDADGNTALLATDTAHEVEILLEWKDKAGKCLATIDSEQPRQHRAHVGV